MKLPEGKSLGVLFSVATGKALDIFGEYEGVKRKKWWIFREPDDWYRLRIVEVALSKLKEE